MLTSEALTYTVTKISERADGFDCLFKNNESGDEIPLYLRITDLYDSHLSVGKVVSDECFEALYEASAKAMAIAKAQNYLVGGVYSKKQLILKLVRAEIDKKYAVEAAEVMEERGYIDEHAQAERIAISYCKRKYRGKGRIIQELLAKGYGKDAVSSAVAKIPKESFKEALMTVIERKYQSPPEDKKERDRRIAALVRLGYSVSEIVEAFRESYR